MSVLKAMFAALGISLEVRNVITDFKLKDGRNEHQAHQIITNGKCTDANIIECIRAELPADCRICSIYEIFIDCEVDELERLAESLDVLKYQARLIYMDKELAAQYVQEVMNGNLN